MNEFIDVVQQESNSEIKPARQHGLYMLNSDYVAFPCVISALVETFGFDSGHAQKIAMSAHSNNEALIGSWNKDIAETKCHLANQALVESHNAMNFDEPTHIFVVREMD